MRACQAGCTISTVLDRDLNAGVAGIDSICMLPHCLVRVLHQSSCPLQSCQALMLPYAMVKGA